MLLPTTFPKCKTSGNLCQTHVFCSLFVLFVEDRLAVAESEAHEESDGKSRACCN